MQSLRTLLFLSCCCSQLSRFALKMRNPRSPSRISASKTTAASSSTKEAKLKASFWTFGKSAWQLDDMEFGKPEK